MREHQKFFSVKNPRTGRIERFITVANIETPDHGATILAGNAKVLAARLSDAKFFWENDLRTVRDVGLRGWAQASPPSPSTTNWGPRPTASPASPRSPAKSPRWSAPRPPRRRGRPRRQIRPPQPDGRRIPRTSGPHGPLLRPSRTSPPRSPPPPRALQPPRPHRHRPHRPRLRRRGAGRQDRHADGLLGHRREAHGEQRPVCAAAGGVGVIGCLSSNVGDKDKWLPQMSAAWRCWNERPRRSWRRVARFLREILADRC